MPVSPWVELGLHELLPYPRWAFVWLDLVRVMCLACSHISGEFICAIALMSRPANSVSLHATTPSEGPASCLDSGIAFTSTLIQKACLINLTSWFLARNTVPFQAPMSHQVGLPYLSISGSGPSVQIQQPQCLLIGSLKTPGRAQSQQLSPSLSNASLRVAGLMAF